MRHEEQRSMTMSSGTVYYPPAGDDWEHRSPDEVGMDPGKLDEAVAFITRHETTRDHDQLIALGANNQDMPDPEIIGPLKERGGLNGLILRHGYLVAEFGDTSRVDMTYSITKSYLSTVAGLALDRGLIRDVDDRVAEYVDDEKFQGPHNGRITWRMLLQQNSEWTGTLWGKRDIADRRKGVDRELREPGTFFEYNDVRVNLLAYALLLLWRRPLPEVLREHVIDPIGASDTWQWHGYRNSYVEIDGRRMQSVSGGGHWGGGMWISTRDHARFGYLFLRRGRWSDRQILPEAWIDAATTPSGPEPTYSYMWWVNPNRLLFTSVPETSFAAIGAGRNIIWVSPEHDLVVVLRWVETELVDECLWHVVAAVEG